MKIFPPISESFLIWFPKVICVVIDEVSQTFQILWFPKLPKVIWFVIIGQNRNEEKSRSNFDKKNVILGFLSYDTGFSVRNCQETMSGRRFILFGYIFRTAAWQRISHA
jgi:hypothetical protein